MKITNKLEWALLLSLAPVLAVNAQEGGFSLEDVTVAEEEVFYASEVEFGLGMVDDDSFKFGEYNGLEEKGGFLIGNFYTQVRPAYDSNDLGYWRSRGRNLGLDSREFNVETGKQGKFKIFAWHEQVPHNKIENGMTVYAGSGSSVLTRPAGWPALADATAMPLAANAMDLDLEDKRKRVGLGFEITPSKHWSVDFNTQRENREGTRLISGIFGSSGGNFKSVIIPEPIDYTTDTVDAGVSYTDETKQFRLSYNGSFFKNNDDFLRWDNLFLTANLTSGPPDNEPGGRGWATLPDAGQLALAPDNQAHYLSLAGGYNVIPGTRIHGQVRYSWLLQDETLQPYTINPAITVGSGLPRNSLDGDIRELLMDLAFNSRVTNKFSVAGNLRYRDTNNDTPRDFYTYIHNDTQPAVQGAITSSDTRKNFAYEYEKTNVNLEAAYRFGMSTKLKGGYDFEQIDRNLQEVDSTDEHTLFAQVSRNFGMSNGLLKYSRSVRDGDNYVDNLPHLVSHHPACAPAGPCGDHENHREIRKYYFADRDRDDVTGALNIFVNDNISVGARATYTSDDYDDTTLGLTEQETRHFSLEPSYRMGDKITAYAYYTWEELGYEQKGHDFRGFGVSNNETNPLQRWKLETEDQVDTFGIGLNWKKVFNDVDLNVEYLYSNAVTEMNASNRFDATDPGSSAVFAGPGVDLPDLDSTLKRLTLELDYAYKENVTYRFLYIWEDFDSKDFALGATTYPIDQHVIGIGDSAPDYDQHVFGASMVYKFK